MSKTKVKEQHIAVFGASGSGKTVLLSSFYGGAQQPSFAKDNVYEVVADDVSQALRLRQMYLRMRNEAATPMTNIFSATSYSFSVRPQTKDGAPKGATASPFDSVRLVWHDYPGEWFENEPSSETEATRRVETFTQLLKSDVALVLVDGQQLLDHAGQEQAYLKSLFWELGGGLLSLKDKILSDGKRLLEFPRIWIIALSKADLHPDLDVDGFRDLVLQKSAEDVAVLRDRLSGFIEQPDALSLGVDYLMLSSARFEASKIELDKRIGLDLILPVATMLPFERVAQWADKLNMPLKLLRDLVDNTEDWARMLLNGVKFFDKVLARLPRVGPVLNLVAVPLLDQALALGVQSLRTLHDQAKERGDLTAAMVTQFRLDLDKGVADRHLIKWSW